MRLSESNRVLWTLLLVFACLWNPGAFAKAKKNKKDKSSEPVVEAPLVLEVPETATVTDAPAEAPEPPAPESGPEPKYEVSDNPSRNLSFVDDAYLGLGNYTQFVQNIQVNDTGGKNKWDWRPMLILGIKFPLSPNWGLTAETAAAYPETSPDSNSTNYLYYFRMSAGYRFNQVVFHGGVGLFLSTVGGTGGTAPLNNGTATDNFPRPPDFRTSQNLTMDLGLEYHPRFRKFLENFSVQLMTHTFSLIGAEKRQVSYMLSASYHFGELFGPRIP